MMDHLVSTVMRQDLTVLTEKGMCVRDLGEAKEDFTPVERPCFGSTTSDGLG